MGDLENTWGKGLARSREAQIHRREGKKAKLQKADLRREARGG